MSDAGFEIEIVRVPYASTLGRAALALRHEVFVVEQHVPVELEIDADDPDATHFVAICEGEIVGTLRVAFKPEHAKICRVAISREHRGRGIARHLMIVAIDYCKGRGVDRFYLSSQVDKVGFYEKLGFVAFGPQYMDAGIPHLAMKTY